MALCAALVGSAALCVIVSASGATGATTASGLSCSKFYASSSSPKNGRLTKCSGTDSAQTGSTGTWNVSKTSGSVIRWQTGTTSVVKYSNKAVLPDNCPARAGFANYEKTHLTGSVTGGTATLLVGQRVSAHTCFYKDGKVIISVNDGAMHF
jgi:hypothetical protein